MSDKEKRMQAIIDKFNERILFRAAVKARKLEFVIINGKDKDE
tara:strand:+ start:295 stop:423 length:129 start_codon:yes stop_codon:yes gene_type:complete